MPDVMPLQVMSAIKARCDAITTGGGFNYSPLVRIGVQVVNLDELESGPVVSIYDTGDEIAEDGDFCQLVLIDQEVIIEAVADFGVELPQAVMSKLWQDICRAVFISDTTLGIGASSVRRGRREFMWPEEGGNTAGVGQSVIVQYFETYGSP